MIFLICKSIFISSNQIFLIFIFQQPNTSAPNNVVPVQSVRAEEMEESARTELLAKSWIVVSSTITDEDGSWTVQFQEANVRLIFSLTDYGTFSSYGSQNGEVQTPYGFWKWEDNAETVIKVWSNTEFSGDAPLYTIESLTKDSLVFSLSNEDGKASFNCIIEPSGRFW